MSSVIYNLNSNDKTLILEPRATFLQSFKALNWTDLRLSMMLSVTKQSDPNDPTGLAETIGTGEDNNQVYIGFKKSDSLFPPSTQFWGVSTQLATPTADPTALTDEGSGASWRIGRFLSVLFCALASNGTTKQNNAGQYGDGSRFKQGLSTTHYAQLISLKMTRNDPTLDVVDTLEAVLTDNSLDFGSTYYGDTSIANIRALTAAATFTTILGPFAFNSVPDAIYLYWPFANSRLRCHSYVLEKYS